MRTLFATPLTRADLVRLRDMYLRRSDEYADRGLTVKAEQLFHLAAHTSARIDAMPATVTK